MKSRVGCVRGKNEQHVQRNTHSCTNLMKLILQWVWCRFIWARIAYSVTWLCPKIQFQFIHIVFLFTKHLISGRLIQLLHACIWYSLKSPLIIYAKTLKYMLLLETSNGHRHVCFKKPYRKVFISYFIHCEQQQQQQR